MRKVRRLMIIALAGAAVAAGAAGAAVAGPGSAHDGVTVAWRDCNVQNGC